MKRFSQMFMLLLFPLASGVHAQAVPGLLNYQGRVIAGGTNFTGTLPSARLSGTYASALTLNNAANSFSGNGANLTSLNAGQLASGNVWTHVHVADVRVLEPEPEPDWNENRGSGRGPR